MDVLNGILFIGIAYILLLLTAINLTKKTTVSLRTSILFGIFIRLLLIALFYHLIHYDTISYRLVGTATLAGQNIYPNEAYKYHPYLPFLLYIEAIAMFFSSLGFPHMIIMKLWFTVFDVFNIYILYKLSGKNRQTAWLYAVHPGLLMLSTIHGQIDSVPITFLLLALLFIKKQKESLSALFLGLGILIKTWPVLLFIFFLKYIKKRVLFLSLVAISPLSAILLYSLLFHSSIIDILHPTLSYRGSYGSWGLGFITAFFIQNPDRPVLFIIKLITTVTIPALIFIVLKKNTTSLRKDITMFLVLFATFSISGANPLWLIPFMMLERSKITSLWLFFIGFYAVIYNAGMILENFQNPIIYIITFIKCSTLLLLLILQILLLFKIFFNKFSHPQQY